MEHAPEINGPWRRTMAEFFTFMRDERGWRFNWIAFGQEVCPVGMVNVTDLIARNDNGINGWSGND